MRRHDGHNQHGGAVARYPANAVLVHHQRFVPVQAPAAGHHGIGEEEHLLPVQLAAVAGHYKGGEFDLGIPVVGDVAHDGAKVLAG
ncbi:hypothetical protein D3C72_2427000 [compost metagenome]